MGAEEIEITIEIVCGQLPPVGADALHLGIQRDNEIIETAPVGSRHIVFTPSLRARRNQDGSVNFLGPFAQGPKGERFIYLNWVTVPAGVPASQIGRIKLHLSHLKWSTVEKYAQANKPIRVKLALTNAKGRPVMASVRAEAAEWQLAKPA